MLRSNLDEDKKIDTPIKEVSILVYFANLNSDTRSLSN